MSALFLSAPAIWFWLALAFAILEIETLGLISIWFVFGSIVAMISSFFITSFPLQIIIFLVVSALFLILTRNYAVKKLKGFDNKTNISALIGAECVVFTEILPHEFGEVKLDGKVWRTKSDSDREYKVGDVTNVQRIEGVTIYID